MNISLMESLKLKESLFCGCVKWVKNQEMVRRVNCRGISFLMAHTFWERKGRKVKTLCWPNIMCKI